MLEQLGDGSISQRLRSLLLEEAHVPIAIEVSVCMLWRLYHHAFNLLRRSNLIHLDLVFEALRYNLREAHGGLLLETRLACLLALRERRIGLVDCIDACLFLDVTLLIQLVIDDDVIQELLVLSTLDRLLRQLAVLSRVSRTRLHFEIIDATAAVIVEYEREIIQFIVDILLETLIIQLVLVVLPRLSRLQLLNGLLLFGEAAHHGAVLGRHEPSNFRRISRCLLDQ